MIVCFIVYASSVSANEVKKVRGLVKASQIATLSSQMNGKIESLPSNIGDKFNKGEKLVQFDCSILNQKISSSRSEVSIKEQQVKNNETLHDFNSIGSFDLNISRAELQKAKSELQVLVIERKNCTVNAPFNGYVIDKFVNKYEAVRQYEKLLSIVNLNELNVEVIVPSIWLRWLKVGDKFTFIIDENNIEIKSSVLNIIPMVDSVSKTIKIVSKIKLDENDIKNIYPGMSGFAYFE